MGKKVIHYCWFGRNQFPILAKKCMQSWKKFFPDYQIIEWNETNLNLEINQYVKEAYKVGKRAFVSDYFRFWILYQYGGIYFDTDVEVIQDFSPLLNESQAICGFESKYGVNPGLILYSVFGGNPIFKEVLESYWVEAFYKMADLFVFPSLREGLPVSVIEAMAAGLPVICTRIRGSADLVTEGRNGCFIEVDRPDSIIQAIERIGVSDNLFYEDNPQEVLKYSLPNVTEMYQRIYESV